MYKFKRHISQSGCLIATVVGLVACSSGATSARFDGPSQPVDSVLITEVQSRFHAPESAHWDPVDSVWYVSNFGQDFDLTGNTPQQQGFLSKLSADGTTLEERFIEVDGDVLGMAILDRKLYVAHVGDLLAIDLSTKEITTITLPGAGFANDVAEGDGVLYITDTGTNTVYRYVSGESAEIFSQDPLLQAPNGIVVDGNRLIVTTLGAFPPDPKTPGSLLSLDTAGVAAEFGTLRGLFDGIEKVDNAFVVADFRGQLFRINTDGQDKSLGTLEPSPMSIADIGFNPTTRDLMIPDIVGNRAFLFSVPSPL